MPTQRPQAPKKLTKEQRAQWKAIVGRMPPDWFTAEIQPTLVNYLAHWLQAERITEALAVPADLTDPDEVKRVDQLGRLLATHTAAMEAKARSMRLTKQSRYDPAKANTATKGTGAGKPWEYGSKA